MGSTSYAQERISRHGLHRASTSSSGSQSSRGSRSSHRSTVDALDLSYTQSAILRDSITSPVPSSILPFRAFQTSSGSAYSRPTGELNSLRAWSPPPPSYLTTGGGNPTGMMALSHEALAKLVDRVAVLRQMGEKDWQELRASSGSSNGNEDDEVEALARQIAAIEHV